MTIDLQYDFFDESTSGIAKLVKGICLPGIGRLLQYARTQTWPIVHVRTVHRGCDSLPRRMRDRGDEPFCLAGSNGAELLDGLVGPGDDTVVKESYSGFLGTTLHQRIPADGIVVLCGVATDCCVNQTAFDAACRHNQRVIVPLEATASSTVEDYVAGLRGLAKSAAEVVKLNCLLNNAALSQDCSLSCEPVGDIGESWFMDRSERLREAKKRAPSAPPRAILADLLAGRLLGV